MERDFLESFVNAEHRVLGLRLRPFCLWHLIALDAVKNPTLEGRWPDEIGPRYAQLLEAARICSGGYDPGLDCLDVPDARGSVDPEERRAARYLVTLELEIEKFHTYLADYIAPPEFYGSGQPAAKSSPAFTGFDDAQVVIGFLCGAGHPLREVLEMPYGQAKWLSASVRATSPGWGKIELIPDAHREAQARVDERRKKEAGG